MNTDPRPQKMLLMSDLDRTLIPNGIQPESPRAREFFRRFAAGTGVRLAYVSGRDLGLVEKAVAEYGLPRPEYAVCDVGTSVYCRENGQWRAAGDWEERLRKDFSPSLREEIGGMLAAVPGLVLQEEEKQGPFKLSFYWDPEAGDPAAAVRARLGRLAPLLRVVASVDETRNQGLLDILPAAAGKLAAARFLVRRLGCGSRAVFAGDSGNDLEVLTSEIPAVLVANATDAVREEALRLAAAAGLGDRLYLARGGFMGMNGNYSAGVLEGVAHFFPETTARLQSTI